MSVQTKKSLLLLTSTLLIASWVTSGCLDTDEGDQARNSEAEIAFDVAPVIAVRTGTIERSDVRLDRVFLGLGTILLEPIDGPKTSGSLIAQREMVPLSFDLKGGYAELGGAAFTVPGAGRYAVSIAIEPMQDPASGSGGSGEGANSSKRSSLVIEGTMIRTEKLGDKPTPQNKEPEPLPWIPKEKAGKKPIADSQKKASSSTQLVPVLVNSIPFEYRSNRTGFIRLGEIDITAEHNEILITIELTEWLDKALAPVLADLIANDDTNDASILPKLSVDSNVDLSKYLDDSGLGELEDFFESTQAEAL